MFFTLQKFQYIKPFNIPDKRMGWYFSARRLLFVLTYTIYNIVERFLPPTPELFEQPPTVKRNTYSLLRL